MSRLVLITAIPPTEYHSIPPMEYHANDSISYNHKCSMLSKLTKHLADVWLNVDILEVLICFGMIQP